MPLWFPSSCTIRRELSPWGITVIIMEPGLFRTDIVKLDEHIKLKEQQWKDLSQDTRDLYGDDYLQQSKLVQSEYDPL